jgi:hypothetical protein
MIASNAVTDSRVAIAKNLFLVSGTSSSEGPGTNAYGHPAQLADPVPGHELGERFVPISSSPYSRTLRPKRHRARSVAPR